MPILIRDYQSADQSPLRDLALASFAQYKDLYHPWEEFQAKVAGWTSLAESAELIVAEDQGVPVGAVAFVPPLASPGGHFPKDWAAFRMLIVDPKARGKGIGKQLTLECIQRARDQNGSTIGLHTSPVMAVALAMYLKLGFCLDRDIEPIYQVPYSVYRLDI